MIWYFPARLSDYIIRSCYWNFRWYSRLVVLRTCSSSLAKPYFLHFQHKTLWRIDLHIGSWNYRNASPFWCIQATTILWFQKIGAYKVGNCRGKLYHDTCVAFLSLTTNRKIDAIRLIVLRCRKNLSFYRASISESSISFTECRQGIATI